MNSVLKQKQHQQTYSSKFFYFYRITCIKKTNVYKNYMYKKQTNKKYLFDS